MIKIIKVTGNSLSPFFLPGDFVLTSNFPWTVNQIQTEDFIVFVHREYGVLIKKIVSIDPLDKSILVAGIYPGSIRSETIGRIQREDFIGKVIWHYKKNRF